MRVAQLVSRFDGVMWGKAYGIRGKGTPYLTFNSKETLACQMIDVVGFEVGLSYLGDEFILKF